jgi:hypothetical protein
VGRKGRLGSGERRRRPRQQIGREMSCPLAYGVEMLSCGSVPWRAGFSRAAIRVCWHEQVAAVLVA